MNVFKSPAWNRLERNWQNGFDTLTLYEQETIALYWLETETMNGTLDQFFWNSSGDMAMLAVSGLNRVQAPLTLAALTSALAVFGDQYSLERTERHAALEVIEDQYGPDVFLDASRIIQDLPEDFVLAAVEQLATLYAQQDRSRAA
ncbi:DMP19 family protein [Chitinilyticum piscinae]|uniref:DUF4375 domain-containing protein n=1 Tax=Chitinilyticum piscinae TaxID=2866724 RepID=A0A8J7KBQ6_9NEIS|nr:DUF4375 domain-containing protein [Chitinilyticum piscinae]MBE9610474.1 DUF4375 domain-containing protein [Chitinilyticum piscinae]